MVLSIKSDEADRLARQLAAETGESLTDAVTEALRARLHEVRRPRRHLALRLLAISEAARHLPRLDAAPTTRSSGTTITACRPEPVP